MRPPVSWTTISTAPESPRARTTIASPSPAWWIAFSTRLSSTASTSRGATAATRPRVTAVPRLIEADLAAAVWRATHASTAVVTSVCSSLSPSSWLSSLTRRIMSSISWRIASTSARAWAIMSECSSSVSGRASVSTSARIRWSGVRSSCETPAEERSGWTSGPASSGPASRAAELARTTRPSRSTRRTGADVAAITASREASAAESSVRGTVSRSSRSRRSRSRVARLSRRSMTATTATRAIASTAARSPIAASVPRGAVCMLRSVRVLLPDGNELTLDEGASGRDAAAAIGPRLADAAVAVQVDGEVRDLRLPVNDGETIRILTDRDEAALAVLRHSTAHVMAQAVLHLWPDAKIAIGPAIADGFYYDFEFPEPISTDDLERIEEEMRRILASDVPFVREDGVEREDLLARFRAEGQPYKLELAEGLDGQAISLYRNDDFEDLCRGPHLQTTKPIKAFKLLSTAGAYWRGDSDNPMLTRIYGTAFFDQAALDEYLERVEQARLRDHRRLGRELDLFHFSDVSPGSPFWHPRGMVIWNELTTLWREL